MRYMLMHKLDENVPGAFDPSPEFIKQMGAFIEEVAKAGVLLAAEGLCQSSKEDAARITATKRQDHHHRRAVHRDQGAHRRVRAGAGAVEGGGGGVGQALHQRLRRQRS